MLALNTARVRHAGFAKVREERIVPAAIRAPERIRETRGQVLLRRTAVRRAIRREDAPLRGLLRWADGTGSKVCRRRMLQSGIHQRDDFIVEILLDLAALGKVA